jgi:hypothetical protein
MDRHEEIFKGKTFSDLMKDVYENQKKKDRQIKLLIAQLEPLVRNLNDAAVVVPLIKEYLDVSVKNDDALIKLAAIVQRMMKDSAVAETGGFILSDEEKKQLMAAMDEVEKDLPKQSDEDDE